MATWPSAAQLFDNLNLKGTDANPLMRAWYQSTLELLGALPAQALPILNGTITPARAVVVVDTEGGAPADDLTLISPVVSATDTLHDGMLLCLKAQAANRVITVRHSAAVNGIRTADGQAVTLGADWWLTLRREGGAWHEMPLSKPDKNTQQRIGALENATSTLKTDTSALKSATSTLKADTSALKTNVSKLQTEVRPVVLGGTGVSSEEAFFRKITLAPYIAIPGTSYYTATIAGWASGYITSSHGTMGAIYLNNQLINAHINSGTGSQISFIIPVSVGDVLRVDYGQVNSIYPCKK